MFENWWMANFRPRRYEEPKETLVTKFVVSVTVLGIILFVVLYLCIFLLRNESENFHADLDPGNTTSDTNDTLVTPEKLISTDFMKHLFQPMPFLNSLRGAQPTSFTPPRLPDKDQDRDLTSSSNRQVTQLLATPNYPQLSNYARPGLPRNIQEIIGYISPFMQQKSQYIENFDHYGAHVQQVNDPFFAYKPKDPSEVNLLATNNLRFAPPAWKVLKSNVPSKIPTNSQSFQTLTPSQTLRKEKFDKKELMLTLNVFPFKEDEKRENYYGTFGDPMLTYGQKLPKPKRMVIHLNIYPNDDESQIVTARDEQLSDEAGLDNSLQYDTADNRNIDRISDRNE